MEVCRVCLCAGADKDIHDLKTSKKKQGSKSPTEIIHFCLGIQLEEDSKITKKLCKICFKKIITYAKFKSMALRSDEALKSVSLDCRVKLEPLNLEYEYADSQVEDFFNETKDSSEVLLGNLNGNKLISDVKEESNEPYFDSDDEILSTLKHLKSEDGEIFVSLEAVTDKNVKELSDSENHQNNILNDKVTTKRRKQKRLSGERKPKRERKSKAKPRDSNGKIIGKTYKADWKNRKVICEECGKSVKNLKEHMITHLPVHLRKTFPCKYPGCEVKFSTYGVRHKHYKRVHLKIKDRCDICNKDYVSLSTHKKQVHQQELMAHKCMFCEKRFVSHSVLELHVNTHTKSRPYACEHCGNLYRTPVCLRNHIRAVHNKERPHMCQFCNKKFFKKCHLDDHVRSHTKEKPFACKICDMKFASSQTLKNHTFTHKTTKDFHCEICAMSFVRIDYLRVHMRTHTKEKRYPCKYCCISFGRSDHRKRHQFTAHEKNMPNAIDIRSRLPQDDDSMERVEDDRESIAVSIEEEKLAAFDVNSVDIA